MLLKTCVETISNCRTHEIVKQAADLYVEILTFYDSVNREPEIFVPVNLLDLTTIQCQKLVKCYISLNKEFEYEHL